MCVNYLYLKWRIKKKNVYSKNTMSKLTKTHRYTAENFISIRFPYITFHLLSNTRLFIFKLDSFGWSLLLCIRRGHYAGIRHRHWLDKNLNLGLPSKRNPSKMNIVFWRQNFYIFKSVIPNGYTWRKLQIDRGLLWNNK